MKKHIGHVAALIGAMLWERGGFWTAESFDDLRLTGKLGYNLMCKGCAMAGYTLDDLKLIANKYSVFG